MRNKKRIAAIVIGWGFVALGIVGLFLPFLQGIFLLVVGLLILSTEYHWARRLIRQLRKRFSWVDRMIKVAHDKYGHLLGRSHEPNQHEDLRP